MDDHHCRDLLGDLSAFVDGEAPAEICAEIERHMAGCGNCRVVVDTLRQTIRLYHALPQPSFSAEARARLYKSLDLGAFTSH